MLSKRRRCVIQADTPELVTLAKKQARKPGVAQLRRVRQYGLEHGLQIAGRARDDAQHFGRRRLLLPRFGEFLFQLRSGFADAANARSGLRCSRTKTTNAHPPLCPFARQGHLANAVDRPMLVAPG